MGGCNQQGPEGGWRNHDRAGRSQDKARANLAGIP